MNHHSFVEKAYGKMRETKLSEGLHLLTPSYTLEEIRLQPVNSCLNVHDVDLRVSLGPVSMNLPLFSAAMDTVTGPHMAVGMWEIGGCGIIYRHKKAQVQIDWIKQALSAKPCLIKDPMCLRPDDPLEDAWNILEEHGFSTIPVTSKSGILRGILFTGDVPFKVQKRMEEPVRKWMKALKDLRVEHTDTDFSRVKERLLNEQNCSVLPVIDSKNRLQGIYFMKDCQPVSPSFHNGKPLVGMAVGAGEADLERVQEGLRLGIGIIVVDSSHGNCTAVIEQSERIAKLAGGKAAVIAGNVASIDGYYRLAQAGVDGVKCGIGSGSICTTSSVTGVGVPMFTLIEELSFMRDEMKKAGMPTPAIIADGGIEGPGNLNVALAAGANMCMSGKWMVAAQESLSYQTYGSNSGLVYYRGMASKKAIRDRSSDRYGKGKTAAEGVEGFVPYRGPLKKWFPEDLELIKGGWAHVGANDLSKLHEFGRWPYAFRIFSGVGQNQILTRVNGTSSCCSTR